MEHLRCKTYNTHVISPEPRWRRVAECDVDIYVFHVIILKPETKTNVRVCLRIQPRPGYNVKLKDNVDPCLRHIGNHWHLKSNWAKRPLVRDNPATTPGEDVHLSSDSSLNR